MIRVRVLIYAGKKITKLMARSLKISLISVFILGGIWLFANQPDHTSVSTLHASPCQQPITYHIGSIDDRFNISERDVLAAMNDAAQAWAEVVNAPLIEHDESGRISVNLKYSDDQETSEQERLFRNRIQSAEFETERLERQFQQLQDEFNTENTRYQVQSNRVQQQIDNLNEWVNETNARGGFTQDELTRFEREKANIDNQNEQLREMENRLADKADEVNNLVNRLNRMIEDKNRLIDRYNQSFAGQRRFTQGTYGCGEQGCELNIFYFTDKEELRLVAAHELGHALGIGHVSNPESIMYHLMGRQAKTGVQLSEEDRQALFNICEAHDS